jgi:hypothetical protein
MVCVLCDKEIPCMFCGGSGEFTPEQKFPTHQCEEISGKGINPEPEARRKS